MSKVQHPILQNAIQPFVFLCTGYLAGYMVEYFPGASQGGLMLTSGLGTMAVLGSKVFAPYPEKEWQSFLRVVASLALGSIIAPLVSKALNGRVQVNFSEAGKLFFLESIAAGGVATISHFMFPCVENRYAEYLQNPDAWTSLTVQERDAFIQMCFDADLPPIPLPNIGMVSFCLLEDRDFNSLSNNQLLWCAEVVRISSFQHYDKITQLFTLLHEKNLPMLGNARSSHAMACQASKHGTTEATKPYFTQNPLGYFMNNGPLDIFQDDERPDPDQFDLNIIRALPKGELDSYLEYYSRDASNNLPLRISVVFWGALHKYGTGFDRDGIEINSQVVVDILKEDENAFEWFYAKYSRSTMKPDYLSAQETYKDQYDALIAQKGKTPIISLT